MQDGIYADEKLIRLYLCQRSVPDSMFCLEPRKLAWQGFQMIQLQQSGKDTH